MIVFIAAIFSLVLVGIFIQLAPRYGIGKAIRADGPETHHSKAGTPTMGGIAFLLAALISWLLFGSPGSDSAAIVLLTVASALLGFYDDLIAVRKNRLSDHAQRETPTRAPPTPEGKKETRPKAVVTVKRAADVTTGLLARYRLLAQALIALPFALYALRNGQTLFGVAALDLLGFVFIIVGSVNAFNFSDGLDGLAAGMAALILLPFIGFSFPGALIGALLGFLWFNAHPARVMMGGVGAEALGAAVAGTAILAGWGWWLPLIAFMPMLEVLSVMIQVPYVKITGGKRFFKMAPLHHHFEKSGWPETLITLRFWLVTAACVGLAWGLRGGLL